MLTTVDILATIEKGKTYGIKQLAKKLEIQVEKLEKTLRDLNKHNIVEYDQNTGKVTLASWLINVNKEVENIKPATGAIVLPKNREIKIQDIIVGNFTKKDLELKIRLKLKRKEIAICDIG